jgi:hypothetical protein
MIDRRARLEVPIRLTLWLGALLLSGASCTQDWDAFDPRLSEGGAPSGPGGSGAGAGSGAGQSGGDGGVGAVGGAGAGPTSGGAGGLGGDGAGGVGGQPPPLNDRGLLARYYLDEATSGSTPASVADAAPAPLDLPMDYSGPVTFDAPGGHAGLTWPDFGVDGGAHATIAGTKIEQIHGSTTGTIECVVELVASSPSSSRLSHIGTGSDPGRFTLYSDEATTAGFDWLAGDSAEEWAVDFAALGRTVLHLVLDTNRADPEDRILLYINGQVQPPGGTINVLPALGATTALVVGTDSYALGNRAIGGRSFHGHLFYSALYTAALTDAEIQENAAILLASDDTP